MDRALHYQLTCPECSHAERLSFVRVGAVAACPACGHRYRVGEANVRHFRAIHGRSTAAPAKGSLGRLGGMTWYTSGTKFTWGIAAALFLAVLTGLLLVIQGTPPDQSPAAAQTTMEMISPAEADPEVLSELLSEIASSPDLAADLVADDIHTMGEATPEIQPSPTRDAEAIEPLDRLACSPTPLLAN